VIIENVGGAGGSIGVGRAVRAPADGYTLNLGQLGSHVMNGAAYDLPYDLLNDLDPVSLIAANPQVIVARSGMPANNLRELIAWLKANPDKASVATVGAGSPSHVSAVYFANATGTRLNLVLIAVAAGDAGPCRQPGRPDDRAGRRSGRANTSRPGGFKAFAVTSKTRLPARPDIRPSTGRACRACISRSGMGCDARGVPKDVLAKVNAAVVETLADETVRKRLRLASTVEIPPREQQTPDGLAAYQKAEIDKWWPIIKAAGIRRSERRRTTLRSPLLRLVLFCAIAQDDG
jgi:tripartite-type tricarboxylate transporter receptor subunit TctC